MTTKTPESKPTMGERILRLADELGDRRTYEGTRVSIEESEWPYLVFALGMAHQVCYENAKPAATPPTAPTTSNPTALKCNNNRVYRVQVKRHGAVTAWRRGFDDGGYSMQQPELLLAAGDWLIIGGPSKGPVLAEMRGEDGSEWWESLQPDPEPEKSISEAG